LGSEETAKSSFGISHGFISVDHLMERMTPEYVGNRNLYIPEGLILVVLFAD
jgi:hypothetical protein